MLIVLMVDIKGCREEVLYVQHRMKSTCTRLYLNTKIKITGRIENERRPDIKLKIKCTGFKKVKSEHSKVETIFYIHGLAKPRAQEYRRQQQYSQYAQTHFSPLFLCSLSRVVNLRHRERTATSVPLWQLGELRDTHKEKRDAHYQWQQRSAKRRRKSFLSSAVD